MLNSGLWIFDCSYLFIKTHDSVSCSPRSCHITPWVYWQENKGRNFHSYVNGTIWLDIVKRQNFVFLNCTKFKISYQVQPPYKFMQPASRIDSYKHSFHQWLLCAINISSKNRIFQLLSCHGIVHIYDDVQLEVNITKTFINPHEKLLACTWPTHCFTTFS